jgi:hypothetical protein
MNGQIQVHTVDQLIANGMGETFLKLAANGGDTGILKPYIGDDGRTYVNKTVRNEVTGQPEVRAFLTNAPATLPIYAWQAFDDVVVRALRTRLGAMADLRARGLEKFIPNAMGRTVLVSQNATDVGPATVSMDPSRRSEGDRQLLDTVNFPLVIVHKDFDFSARELASSQNAGVNGVNFSIDTEGAESAAYAVAKLIDEMLVGTAGTFSYGGGTIYGYTNFPDRVVKTDMTVPDGTNGTTVLSDILSLRQSLIDTKHYGPFMLYMNSQWSAFLDNEFKTNSDLTLRQRILAIDGILGIRILDTLPTVKYDLLLVEMMPQTVRAIVGFEAQTVRWESMGGMMHHYKVMAMILGQIRPDVDGNSGVGHARTGV